MIASLYISPLDFLTPIGWWGLLGLAVPIIIHFLSKREKNIVSFGTLRFLQPIESDSARSLQLSQYWLLLVRILLLGLICLLLVEPFINKEINNKSYWIEKSIYTDNDYDEIVNNLPEKAEVHVYSHTLTDSVGVQYFPSAWTLIQKLNDDTDSSVVYSHSLQESYIGEPVALSSKVDWIIIPYKRDTEDRKDNWTVISDQDHIAVSGIQDYTEDQRTLSLRLLGKGYEEESNAIKKVIDLSQAYLLSKIEWIDEGLDPDLEDKTHFIVVVGQENKVVGNNVIQWLPSDRELTISTDDGLSLSIEGNINKENIIDTNLPVRMAASLNNYITDIHSHDLRVLDPSQFIAYSDGISDIPLINAAMSVHYASRPLHRPILLLIVFVFMIECFLNYKSSQG